MDKSDIEFEIVQWLKREGVYEQISKILIEDFIICKLRFYECEEKNSEFGTILKNKNGEAEPSPFVEIALSYLKQSYKILDKIEIEVKKIKRRLEYGSQKN